ncbi:hypothetical protein A4A49_04597 [Nicotiana attenuata]|uniref:FAS1 domain-containing protein n=2 Tax=Nicotiana attenuata TaxID=49451 RepID=A0A314KY55_NICAT|nr:hypothetical protein A4A49_04597 [Nicotiana attenuata]
MISTFLYTQVRMMIRNGRTIAPNSIPLYLNDTNFDLAILKSLPEKTEYKTPAEALKRSNLKINNEATEIPTTPPPYQQPNTTTFPPPPPLTQHQIQEQQLNNIVEALIGAGDFAGWANLLSSTDLSSLPLSATFFIPGNDAMSNHQTPGDHNINLDPFLIAYHIIPQRLSFADLQQFKSNTRLPTLLPSKFIVITNNSLTNFTVDGSQITYPDVYVNSAFTVHGVNKVLEYSVYGADHVFSPPENNTVPTQTVAPIPPKTKTKPKPKPKTLLFPEGGGGFIDGWRSSNSTRAFPIEKLMFDISVLFFIFFWV